jgi:hypothetical protein
LKTKLNAKSGERDIVHDRESGQPCLRYWSKPVPSILLDASGAEEIGGAGYYRIPPGWIQPEPEPEGVPLAELRRVNEERLKKLRVEAVKERRRANWDKYVEAHRNEYILCGGVEDDGAPSEV